MAEAKRIADSLNARLGPEPVRGRVPWGTLRAFGDWFGRPMDNRHDVVRACADQGALVVRFDQGEVLRVWGATGIEFVGHGFAVTGAQRCLWRWYGYGGPHLPENLSEIEHRVDGDLVRVTRTGATAFERSLTRPLIDRTVALVSP